VQHCLVGSEMCIRDRFEAWDKAILDFASAANVDRNYAIVQVRTVLGMAN
jgi:hypothetical protein